MSQPQRKRKYRHRRHHFLAAWLRSPKGMGALLPSSRGLARAMVGEINRDVPGVVIELGAGTGVMTHAILQAGITPDRLLVIERDPRLCTVLARQFQGVKIICADARDLRAILEEQGITEICAIVSSLPFLSMPKPVSHVIQEQMASVIGRQGVVVQFTYGMQSPIQKDQLAALQLESKRTRLVFANVPPAHVWVYRKPAPLLGSIN